jgi:putative transposase
MVEIIKSQKIRIYPNKHNQEVFEKYYDYQRSVWNRAIDERNRQYIIYKEQKDSGNFTQKELNKFFYPSHINLRKMKKEDWELKFHCRIRNVQFERLCETWDNYFNPNMPNHQKPKYKKKKDIETLKKVGFKDVRFKDKKMFLPNARKSTNETKFSAIRMSEKIRFDGKQIEDVVVTNHNGEWFVSVSFKFETEQIKRPEKAESTAVDLNIKSFDFLVTHNKGNKYGKFTILDKDLLKEYDKIKYYSKVISKKRNKNKDYKNSKSYNKVITKLNNAYTKAYNLQENKLNHITHFLFENYSTITIEDLDVNSMKMNKRLCKSLHRALFGRFKTKMTQKQQEYEANLVIADKFFPSTQRCSSCGHIKTGEDKLGLNGDRFGNKHNEYVCYNCGEIQERDKNAVNNLDWYGLNAISLV